jgi:competence protein ComEA
MFKTLVAILMAFFAAVAFAAAVDVNKANQAELEAVKGIGPAIATKILDERKKAPFKDWNDMIERVKGVGESNAARFSAEGLTVNGAAFKGSAPAATAAKKEDKASVKRTAAAASAIPTAAAASAVQADAKKAKEAKREAASAAKAASAAEAKAAKAAKAASAAEAKKAKDEKKAAKAAESKASEAKPAAKK